MEPALLLFPNLLAKATPHEDFLPSSIDRAVSSIDGLIAESLQGGRSFLNHFRTKRKPNEIPIALLNEHSGEKDLEFLLEPVLGGERWGLVSDAGIPCVADPGSDLVLYAKKRGVKVIAYTGPSSIILSLMLSGLPGQRFCFHGYLSKLPDQRKKEILQLELRSKKENATQIFIEAPYRNLHTFNSLVEFLQPRTLLCIGIDLTLPTEEVLTFSIEEWKVKALPNLSKRPVIFLIYTR